MANLPGPVAIGGVGGSGTRVVAKLLIRMGFYMGSDLNPMLDNLCFSFLFVRPRWLKKNINNHAGIFKACEIFDRVMKGNSTFNGAELPFIIESEYDWLIHNYSYFRKNEGSLIRDRYRWIKKRISWTQKRISAMVRLRNTVSGQKFVGWGWKEPNTHIFIDYLSQYFSNLKYIHVMRHGFDMAFSRNQNQLHRWGKFLGVDTSFTAENLPRASLQYWITSNQRAKTLGEQLLGNRFYVLNFDLLCSNPKTEIEKLLEFLELDGSKFDMAELSRMAKKPESMGRYKKIGSGIFGKKEIAAVRLLGFTVEDG